MKIGSWLPRLAQAFLGAGLLCVYLATMAPGLTWANGGSDGGDLIAAAATGGIPHPTGYPVFLILARLFEFLPVGSLAYRTNLLSALATVGAALLVCETVRRSLSDVSGGVGSLAGVVAGTSFGLAPLVWSQAVITEVYALHALFIAAIIYLLGFTKETRSPFASWGIGLTVGLAAGNQVLALLMAPVALVATSLTKSGAAENKAGRLWSRLHLGPRAGAEAGLGICMGLLVYAILPVRAGMHPPVNWGAPVTLQRFGWLVSGGLYQDSLLRFDLNSLWTHLQAWANLTFQQVGLFGLILALLGLIVFFEPSRIHVITIWTAIAFTAFALQYSVSDSYVYLLPVQLAFSIWIGWGVGRLSRLPRLYSSHAGWVVGVAALAYFLILGSGHWQQVDASHDLRAEMFGQQVLRDVPAQAILLTEGDRAVFSLWYFHFGLHLRPDVTVLADSLLPFDWYRENLRRTYPGLVLPDRTPDTWVSAIIRANPGRPACFAGDPPADFVCSPNSSIGRLP